MPNDKKVDNTPDVPPPDLDAELPIPEEAAADKPKDQSAAAGKADKAETKTQLDLKAKPHHRLIMWYKSHKKWSIPLTVIIILLLILAVPWSRYKTLGLAIKKDVKVHVLDSESNVDVTSASVEMAGQVAKSDSRGVAHLKNVPVGIYNAKISKKYYKDEQLKVEVGLTGGAKTLDTKLAATGRQVLVDVKNKINNKPLEGVVIKAGDAESKTNKAGQATLVLPAGTTKVKTELSLSGYNSAAAEIETSSKGVKQNNLTLTPNGKVYYLSNRTGKINIMKSNLDGSDEKLVLEGTGSENTNNTVFLPSTDWKYLSLLTTRKKDDSSPQLYVISTSDDKPTVVDESPVAGKTNFSLDGWISGSYIVYRVTRNDLKHYELGYQKLKSYNADTGKLTTLDQTVGEQEGFYYVGEYYRDVFLLGDSVIFAQSWDRTITKQRDNSLSSISPNGQNNKTIARYDTKTYYLSYRAKPPSIVYIARYPYSGGGQPTYFSYNEGDAAPTQVSLTANDFNKSYPSHMLSPNGKKSAFSEQRDGKAAIIITDPNGENEKIIAKLDEFGLYGWYTNEYLLVTKKNKELYIMSVDGGNPQKVADFHPTTNYEHYY